MQSHNLLLLILSRMKQQIYALGLVHTKCHDEEWREDAIDKMTVALEKCPDEDIIIAFTRLCERVEEFMA